MRQVDVMDHVVYRVVTLVQLLAPDASQIT